MSPGELAKFDQMLEHAIETSLRMAAQYDEASVGDAMLGVFTGLMQAAERAPELIVESLAMNVAGLAIRMRRMQLEQKRVDG
jgi:hypothetical protein